MAKRRVARVLSIDAIHDGDGWIWNDSREAGEILLTDRQVDRLERPRACFALLRREGYLTTQSAGKIVLDVAHGDPSYYTVTDRSGRPHLAIVVGWSDTAEDIREK